MQPAEREIQRKLRVLEHAKALGNVSKACRFYGISRELFYEWKRAFDRFGEAALKRKKPGPVENLARRIPKAIEEKILYLRQQYHFGPLRIVWYLHRYHGIKVSGGGVITF